MTPRHAAVLLIAALVFLGATHSLAAGAGSPGSSAAATAQASACQQIASVLSQVLSAINPIVGLVPYVPGPGCEAMDDDDPSGGHLPGPDPYPGGVSIALPPSDSVYPGDLPKL